MFDRLGPQATEPDRHIRERGLNVNYPDQEHHPPGDPQYGEHHDNLDHFKRYQTLNKHSETHRFNMRGNDTCGNETCSSVDMHNSGIRNPVNHQENNPPLIDMHMNHDDTLPTLEILETLVQQKTPDEVAVLLNSMSTENMHAVLDEVFNSDITHLHRFLEVLAKCCKSYSDHILSALLGKLLAYNFFAHPKVHHVMLQVISDYQDDGKIHNVVSIFEIVNQIMIHRPSDVEHIQVVLVLLDGIMLRTAGHHTHRLKELRRLHLALSEGEHAYNRYKEH